MPDLPVQLNKGVRTIGAEARLPPGFLRSCMNWIYALDDEDRLHKIPGRTLAKALPAGATEANTKGLVHLQFDQGTDQVLVANNSKYSKADAGTTLGTFTDVADQAVSPVAFVRSGSFIKTIPDGRNGNIIFGGVAGERPLIIDADGTARYLSLKKPSPPTVAAVSGVGVETTGNAQSGDFDNGANCVDGDKTTYASDILAAAATVTHTVTYSGGGATLGPIFVKIGTSALPGDDTDWEHGVGGVGERTEAFVATIKVEISQDGAPTWVTVFEERAPLLGDVIIQHNSDADTFANLTVRVSMTYHSGTTPVEVRFYETWVSTTGGSTALVTDGTYHYATTEVLTLVLTSGETVVVESQPSDTVSFTTSSDYGVDVTPGGRVNLVGDGIADANISRRIYRTNSTGSWPNLGYVGDAPIGKAVFSDNFETAGASLGSPGIYTVTVGSATLHAAGMAPAMRDATLYRGAIVCIPEDRPKSIQWSLPGQPEYFPLPAHDLPLLPRERNEELKGVVAMGDSWLMVLTRTQVVRVKDLVFANQSVFDLGNLDMDIISKNQGLAGSPKAYALFESQRGHTMLGWVSDNGIWMTDGALPSERGVGTVKLSVNLHWDRDVDTTRLAETTLTFDSAAQILHFDYYDRDSNRQSYAIHTSGAHWIPSGENQLVPKITGPHPITLLDRAIGELSGEMHQWSVSGSALSVYNERTGTDDAGSDILSHGEFGWLYPAGPLQEFHIHDGIVYHSDWGIAEALGLDLLTRRDRDGVTQPVQKRGLRLRGEGSTDLGWLDRSGQCFKIHLIHNGKTTSSGTPVRAIGPIVLDIEPMGDIES